MVAEPTAIPVTTPDAFTVAMEVLLLIHPPPATESVRVMVVPAHNAAEPEMEATVGKLFTVTNFVATTVPQPEEMV